MKKLILLALAAIPAFVSGQPAVNNAGDFSIGTVLKFQVCDPTGINAGGAGANQTWDFSSLVKLQDTITEWMVAPSSTTHGSQFPMANQVEKYSDGKFVYVMKTDSESFLVGFVDTTTSNPEIHYPNPLLFAKRPYHYGTVITDTFTMTGSSAPGVVTLNPDAYGTLILPNGTHNNVLRVKISQVHPFYSSVIYVWFDGIHASALLKIDEQQEVDYLLDETTGIKETGKQKNFSFYPNPATKQVLFETDEAGELSVTNQLGQLVFRTAVKDNQVPVSTEHLEAGVYYMTFTTKKGTATSKLVVQH